MKDWKIGVIKIKESTQKIKSLKVGILKLMRLKRSKKFKNKIKDSNI